MVSTRFLVSAVAVATVVLPPKNFVLAYMPSIPRSNPNTIDISSVLAETAEALKIVNDVMLVEKQDVSEKKPVVKTMRHASISPSTINIDISSVLAEAEAALQAAGIEEELNIVTELLAESIEETKVRTKRLAKPQETCWKSMMWDTTSSVAVNTGKAIFSFTKEQLKPESELSKFSQSVVRECKEKISTLDLTKVERQNDERLRSLVEILEKYGEDIDVLSLLDRAKGKVAQSTNKISSSWQQEKKKLVRGAFESPFVKVWEDRASQFRATGVQADVVTPSKARPSFFMTEKKTERSVPQKKPFVNPVFVAGHKTNQLSSIASLAKKFVQSWVTYASSVANGSSSNKSLQDEETIAEVRSRILETLHASRLAAFTTKANVEKGQSIPYFARLQTEY